MVYEELVRILTQLLQKQFFKRFPTLKERFQSVVIAFFKKALNPTNKLVQDLVNMEACYINTAHPDFLNGHKAMAIVTEKIAMGKGQTLLSTDTKQIKNKELTANTNLTPAEAGLEQPGFFGSFFYEQEEEGRLGDAPANVESNR